MPTLELLAPLSHQLGIDGSPVRFKVWAAGRRTGKTTWAGKACGDGQGPLVRDSETRKMRPKWRGLLQGRDIAWIVRDNTQSAIFWHEFVEPTFREIGKTNKSEHWVDMPQCGSRLWIRSGENIASIRGMGKNL